MKVSHRLQSLWVMGFVYWTLALACGAPVYYNAESAEKLGPGAGQRIEHIAAMLEDEPRGFGISIEQRDFWDAVGTSETGRSILRQAESLLKQPMPVLTDELYLQYSQNGNRSEAEKVIFAREDRLDTFCLAECIENKGRFLAALEEILDSTISYPTWVYPAHDGNLDNFHQKNVTIDLKSARDAHSIALYLFMLKGKIDDALAEKAQTRIHKLIFAPYVRDVFNEEGSVDNWWKTSTNNWNSVCHAGVVGAAVTMLEDKLDRALFIERASSFTDYYYEGFTADGYCSEGLGYWNYGFGQYIVLSEVIYHATCGKMDLFSQPKGLSAALYPFRVEIMNKHYPSLADCGLNARPDSEWMAYVNSRLGLQDDRWPPVKETPWKSGVFEFLMFSGFDSNRPAVEAPFASDHNQLRTWFSDAGVLICRPAKTSGGSFAAVLKGGHNAEHHNHNDLGTFIVIIGDQQVILDPGSVEYTRTTFSKDRYTIKKLSSYGHPVPLIAGQEQTAGRTSQAVILRHEFTEETDTLAMDLKSAYPVTELEKLERTFVYSRQGTGSLEVTDVVEYSEPQTFETALITYGTYEKTGANTLEVTEKGKTAAVEIDSGENSIEIADDLIESTNGSPRRIAVRFEKPVKKGQISMRIWPK